MGARHVYAPERRPRGGGGQCGAVRYEIDAPLEKIHLCHCRMCQRALAGCPKERLRWPRGAPKLCASSSQAMRGFCADCGTPLTFAYREAARVYVAIGSLDDPASAPPTIHYGAESWLPWLQLCAGLPREATADDPRLRGMAVHQAPTGRGGSGAHGRRHRLCCALRFPNVRPRR